MIIVVCRHFSEFACEVRGITNYWFSIQGFLSLILRIQECSTRKQIGLYHQKHFFLFASGSEPSLEPTQPLIQWITADNFSEDKAVGAWC